MQKRQNNKELYDKYITPNMGDVKTLVRYYNNNSYGGDYEEMLSEVCVNFFKHIHTYDPSKRLSTWIHICVQREVARIFRRKQRENETYDQFGSYSEADFCTSNETAVEPDDCLDESWYREHVGDEMLLALRRLEP
ncbi:MAG: sigma-70 family RNA polymerase sigma factor, partial [Bacteroides sp.]